MTGHIIRRAGEALRAAIAEAGSSDFGPDDFREPFETYVRYVEVLPFTDEGRAGQYDLIHRWLVNRLRFADDLKRHPEILDEDVSDPIVILGFPRSGTTVLQRMMSADSSKQSLKMWRVFNPAPFPGEDPKNPVERIAYAKGVEDAMRTLNPAGYAAHPLVAEDADEDYFLHLMSFRHIGQLWFGLMSEAYLAYLQRLDRQPTYDFVGNMLRYLQWQDGGRRGRRWILKSPAHVGNIEQLLKVHPKATFVYPRRDFLTVMASFCHTADSNLNGAILLSPEEIGTISLNAWRTEMQRFQATRDRLGDRLTITEMNYRDMLSDPIGSIRHILGVAGSPLTEQGEAEIRQWVADNPAGKHGVNTYTLDHYGLTERQVQDAFGEFE